MRFHKIIAVLSVAFALQAAAQTITPQVINVGGDQRQLGTGGLWITDNVGEPFTEMLGSPYLSVTQGFIQPDVISVRGFTYFAPYQSPACLETNRDAFISLQVKAPSTVKSYTATYLWSPQRICPNNDCAKIDSLSPGTYSAVIVVAYKNNLGVRLTDTLRTGDFNIIRPTSPCKILVYTGVTPNNDYINDVLTIDNITDYPNNRVTIYNRWGFQLADIKGYNNSTKFWPTRQQLDFLSSTTYFYIIELEPGGNPIKGWVELIKNE